MQNNENIYQHITARQIKAYLSGSMSPSEKEAFEKIMNENPFVADSVHGYQQNPDAFNDLPSIEKQIGQHYGKISWLRYSFYLAVPVIIIVLFVALFPKSENIKILSRRDSTLVVQWQSMKNEVEKANPIPVEKQIAPLEKKHEQKAIKSFEEKKTTEEIEQIQNIAMLGQIENIKPEEKVRKHFKLLPTTYYYELKAVIYDKERRPKIKMRINNEGTLSPQYENYSSLQNNPDEVKWTYIEYTDFLSDAMGKFSNSRVKEALLDFNYILQVYNDDLNANFYGGLCYYNLGLYNKAISCFDGILNDNSITFFQEALWYKALSLYNAGQKDEAEKLFSNIAESNGFYSAKATERLKILNAEK